MGLPKGRTDLKKKKKNYKASQKEFTLFFLDFWIRVVKVMCPRVGKGLYINLQKQKPIVNKQHPCLVIVNRQGVSIRLD